ALHCGYRIGGADAAKKSDCHSWCDIAFMTTSQPMAWQPALAARKQSRPNRSVKRTPSRRRSCAVRAVPRYLPGPAKKRIEVSLGESVRIIRELQGPRS